MTITATPLSVEHRGSAVSASAWFHTSDPGEFVVDYPTGITGPASVTAAGSRARWLSARGNGIACVADASNLLSARGEAADRCATFCIDLDLDSDVFRRARGYYGGFMTIAASYRDTGAHSNNLNWALLSYDDLLEDGSNQYYIRYAHSPTANSNPTYLTGSSAFSPTDGVNRIILVMDQANLYIYLNDGVTPLLNNAHTQASGVMSAPVYFQLRAGRRAAYYLGVMSQSDRVAWMSGNTPSGAVSSWSCGQEPTDGGVIYDLVGTNDLTAAAFTDQGSGDYALPIQAYTDTGFTSPLVEIPLTIAADCTAGVHEIQLRRTRVGIPARVPALPDAVLYDDGTIPVTVVAIPAVVHTGPVQIIQARMSDNPVAYVQITSDREGTVAISCDRTIIDFPLTAIIGPSLEVTIEGAILKGGDCDVTAVMV